MKYLPIKQSVLTIDYKYYRSCHASNNRKYEFVKIYTIGGYSPNYYYRIILRGMFSKYMNDDVFIFWKK
jgi:hypothetical protein